MLAMAPRAYFSAGTLLPCEEAAIIPAACGSGSAVALSSFDSKCVYLGFQDAITAGI